jgi:hypothetical protein
MRRQFSVLVGSTALATLLSLAATAQANKRGVAIQSPVDCPDAPPHNPNTFIPYYGSPLTPISTRWRTIVCVPYYRGYCRPHNGRGECRYGCNGDGLPGPGCAADGLLGAGNYGPYTGAPRDEARLLHLGGNAPYLPSQPGAMDIIDAIQGSHGPGGVCPP